MLIWVEQKLICAAILKQSTTVDETFNLYKILLLSLQKPDNSQLKQ